MAHGYEAGLGGSPIRDPYEGRRQLDTLTAEELRACPVWWFPGRDGHLSGPDESTVMPLSSAEAAPDGSAEFPDGRYLLHLRCELADGTVLDGHLTWSPDDAGHLREREPTLVVGDVQIPLWHGVLEPDAAWIAEQLAHLGRSVEQVFPLHWDATIHPVGDTLAGTARGFAVWRDGMLAWLPDVDR